MKKALLLFLMFLSVVSCTNPPGQAATTDKSTIFYKENLEVLKLGKYAVDSMPASLLNANEGLKISTRRDYRSFCDKLVSLWGDDFVRDSSGSPGAFPGSGNYSWISKKGFGQNHLEIALEIDTSPYYNFAFRFFDDHELPIQSRPEVIHFMDSLLKTTLLNQPVLKIAPEYRPNLYLPDEFRHQNFAKEEVAFAQMVRQNYPNFFAVSRLSVKVDKQGNGEIITGDGDLPDSSATFFTKWVKTLNFPIVIYDTCKDTATYIVTFETVPEDSVLINYVLGKAVKGDSLPQLGELNISFIAEDSLRTGSSSILAIKTPGGGVYFFEKKKEQFIPAGKHKDFYSGYMYISFIDYDFDGLPELQLEAMPPNMNGNTLKQIYKWDPNQRKMNFAGSFFGDISLDRKKREVIYEYAGSWYADHIIATYGWSHGRLIPKYQVTETLRQFNQSENDCCIEEFYTNPYFKKGIDTLVLVSKK